MRTRVFLFSLTSMVIASVQADIIPNLQTTNAVGGDFRWNYINFVTGDETVHTSDFFTIYDFGNFVAGSNLQPANWTFSSSLLGVNPGPVIVADNPSLLNLTWQYTGTTPIDGSALLGIFSVITNTDQLRTAQFASEATRLTGPNAGTKIDNVGTIAVPLPEASTLLPIIGVCGVAMIAGVPSLLRRRKTA